jgi:hypothetical protein
VVCIVLDATPHEETNVLGQGPDEAMGLTQGKTVLDHATFRVSQTPVIPGEVWCHTMFLCHLMAMHEFSIPTANAVKPQVTGTRIHATNSHARHTHICAALLHHHGFLNRAVQTGCHQARRPLY